MEQNNYQMGNDKSNPVYNQTQVPYQGVRRTKSKFLTFVFACCFGAGQMYQGHMKKGVSIMGITFGIVAIATWLYIPFIALILPVIWFYAFFDCINKMNYTVDELRMLNDTYLFNFKFEKNNNITSLFAKRHVLFGAVLIAVGVYALFSIVLDYSSLYYLLDERVFSIIRNIFNSLPKLFIPILITIIGIKLITGGKQKSDNIKTISSNSSQNI